MRTKHSPNEGKWSLFQLSHISWQSQEKKKQKTCDGFSCGTQWTLHTKKYSKSWRPRSSSVTWLKRFDLKASSTNIIASKWMEWGEDRNNAHARGDKETQFCIFFVKNAFSSLQRSVILYKKQNWPMAIMMDMGLLSWTMKKENKNKNFHKKI